MILAPDNAALACKDQTSFLPFVGGAGAMTRRPNAEALTGNNEVILG